MKKKKILDTYKPLLRVAVLLKKKNSRVPSYVDGTQGILIFLDIFWELNPLLHEADIGVAGGIGEGLLIKKGEIVKKVPEDQLLAVLKDELDHWNK